MNIHELTIQDNLHPVRLFGQRQQQRLFLWLTLLQLKKGNNISIKILYEFTTSSQKAIKKTLSIKSTNRRQESCSRQPASMYQRHPAKLRRTRSRIWLSRYRYPTVSQSHSTRFCTYCR